MSAFSFASCWLGLIISFYAPDVPSGPAIVLVAGGFFIISLLLISNFFAVVDYSSYSSALFHTLSGGTMLAAFFILTDPVSGPSISPGFWPFAIGIGGLTFLIRTTGAYPEGVAFAVLLMNGAVPLLDHYLTSQTSRQGTKP